MPENAGTLYIVATPIGNLDDMSPRGRRILEFVDVILCEDTRHTSRLASAFGIDTKRLSFHEHNEAKRLPQVIAGLREGRNYALVSDAGTPLVSDPGYRLLTRIRELGLTATPVPGPCAAIAALSVAGLATDRFVFEGFLPSKQAARRARLEVLMAEPRTMVFYETGKRIVDMLGDAADVMGAERPAAVCRELTKAFESIYRDDLGGLQRRAASDPDMVRGEIAVIIAGAETDTATTPDIERLMRAL
ncbi:MAG: 16S rRNA (cytidine(1402)-2'-O)-methyltransferase, partial [Gammaproteobacteria bacterium]